MTTNEERERVSDEQANPTVWYAYILDTGDGDYYIGQTNDLPTRLAEHALGGGALATQGKSGRLVWFSHTHDREAARRMEERLKSAKERGELAGIVAQFDDLIRLVRPEKTLAQLEEEDRRHRSLMRKVMHWCRWVDLDHKPARCGWIGETYGYMSPGELIASAERHDAAHAVDAEPRMGGLNREPCPDCLPIAKAAVKAEAGSVV